MPFAYGNKRIGTTFTGGYTKSFSIPTLPFNSSHPNSTFKNITLPLSYHLTDSSRRIQFTGRDDFDLKHGTSQPRSIKMPKLKTTYDKDDIKTGDVILVFQNKLTSSRSWLHIPFRQLLNGTNVTTSDVNFNGIKGDKGGQVVSFSTNDRTYGKDVPIDVRWGCTTWYHDIDFHKLMKCTRIYPGIESYCYTNVVEEHNNIPAPGNWFVLRHNVHTDNYSVVLVHQIYPGDIPFAQIMATQTGSRTLRPRNPHDATSGSVLIKFTDIQTPFYVMDKRYKDKVVQVDDARLMDDATGLMDDDTGPMDDDTEPMDDAIDLMRNYAQNLNKYRAEFGLGDHIVEHQYSSTETYTSNDTLTNFRALDTHHGVGFNYILDKKESVIRTSQGVADLIRKCNTHIKAILICDLAFKYIVEGRTSDEEVNPASDRGWVNRLHNSVDNTSTDDTYTVQSNEAVISDRMNRLYNVMQTSGVPVDTNENAATIGEKLDAILNVAVLDDYDEIVRHINLDVESVASERLFNVYFADTADTTYDVAIKLLKAATFIKQNVHTKFTMAEHDMQEE